MASESKDVQEKNGTDAGNARAHYHSVFGEMAEDVRSELASRAEGFDLRALCYDPLPRVIHAVLSNPNCTTEHARIIAKEHHNGVGLGHVARNPRYLRDPEVRRQLLKNKHSGPKIIERLIGNQPLITVYKTAIDRNVPEQTRTFARTTMKRSWNNRESDEKVALIIKTEGRCLPLLIGQSLDGKSAAKLCGRSAMSTMLIRNLCRWPSTPPPVLQHMARLPAVGRDRTLKQLLMKHPNLPSQIKRNL